MLRPSGAGIAGCGHRKLVLRNAAIKRLKHTRVQVDNRVASLESWSHCHEVTLTVLEDDIGQPIPFKSTTIRSAEKPLMEVAAEYSLMWHSREHL